MKKHITLRIIIQRFIIVIGLFIFIPTIITAQNTREDIKKRITLIENEMNILNHKREAIGLEFKAISNFSTQARPVLLKYYKFEEDIKLKQDEKKNYAWLWEAEERMKKEDEISSLISKRDSFKKQYRTSGGIISCFNFKCITIEALQNEYSKMVNYYKEQKKKYDDMVLALEKLNNEKVNLVSELKYAPDLWGVSKEKIINLEGCWQLRTGKYISQIDVIIDATVDAYLGFVEVSNLKNYSNGQHIFTVQWVHGGTYRGKEITYNVDDNGNSRRNDIPMKITIDSSGNFLTWTSTEETVTMQRCPSN